MPSVSELIVMAPLLSYFRIVPAVRAALLLALKRKNSLAPQKVFPLRSQ